MNKLKRVLLNYLNSPAEDCNIRNRNFSARQSYYYSLLEKQYLDLVELCNNSTLFDFVKYERERIALRELLEREYINCCPNVI